MYEKYFKRFFDVVLSIFALAVFSPLFAVLMIMGAVAMHGNPFFVQRRPGIKDGQGHEKIFRLIKFRTMDNRRDTNGELMPDDVRLNRYGRFLRNTSLDELPEALNILKGDMSIVGPRPQLVRDMVFMTEEQRQRHNIRPGLTGLAQVNGRNSISWEKKLNYDLEYIRHITFWGDVKIILQTVWNAFVCRKDISAEGMETAEDLGDYLLRTGLVNDAAYAREQENAKKILNMM